MNRKFLPLVLILTMVFSLVGFNSVSYAAVGGEFEVGSGTQADPYLIATAVQLNNVRNYLGPDHHDTYFKLVADIDLNIYPFNQGEGWEPIGNWDEPIGEMSDNYFYGNFDGGGKIISNLYINLPDTTDNPSGLFGVTNNATIKNLNLQGVKVTGYDYVGGLVGDIESSYISNVTVTGEVIGNNDYIGGIAGYTYASLISNVSFDGSVIGRYDAGGLVGEIYESAVRISSSMGSVQGNAEVGGLVGISYGSSIFESNSGSSVTGTYFDTNDSTEIGGLVGRNHYDGTINKSYATGDVTGTDVVGGLIGDNGTFGKVTDSYATGNVSSDAVDTSDLSFSVGGLAGTTSTTSTVQNCYSVSSVIGVGKYHGGLVGDNYFHGFIVSSYSLGPDNGVGKVIPLEEMKSHLTFDGWNFVDIWAINEGESYPYLLQNQLDAEIASMKDYSSIAVPYGTPLSDVDLPFMAFAVLDDTTIVPLPVTWDRDGSSYDGFTPGDYTFTGTLALADGITNPNGDTASITVTVWPSPKQITAVEPIADITVPLGTAHYLLEFPSTVVVTLDNIVGETRELNVEWDYGTPEYDGETAGEYVFTGEIFMEYDIINPTNLTAEVKVIVAVAADAAPVINDQPEDVTVKVGKTATFSVGYTAKPDPSFQWQISKNGGKKWSNIPGANYGSYDVTEATMGMNGYLYRVILNNGVGTPVISNAAKLTVIYAEADVQIVQRSGDYDPATGEIVWHIAVYNAGPDTAQGVVIKNTLASNTKLIYVSPSNTLGSSLKGKTVSIDVVDMESSRGIEFEIKVLVTKATSSITNTATVTSTSEDLYLDNNKSTTIVSIQ